MIKPKFTANQVRNILDEKRDRVIQAIQLRLLKVGESFVINARNNGNYKDHTGNLRGSIGYVLLKDGIQVNENFQSFAPAPGVTEDSGLGPDQAKAVIDEIIGRYPEGLVLICVAGMEYAAAVESKNYDVITSSALIAVDELKKGIETIKSKAGIN